MVFDSPPCDGHAITDASEITRYLLGPLVGHAHCPGHIRQHSGGDIICFLFSISRSLHRCSRSDVISRCLEGSGPTAAYTNVTFPVVALTLSTIFEHFQWTKLAIVGVTLILFGNLVILTPSRMAFVANRNERLVPNCWTTRSRAANRCEAAG
jgi:hypothetical protein